MDEEPNLESESSPDYSEIESPKLLEIFYFGKDGDAAFQTFWERHQREVLRTAQQYVTAYDDALDVAQEVALRICRRRNIYDPDKGKVGAWLTLETQRTAIDYYRRKETRRKRETPSDDDFDHPDVGRASPEVESQTIRERCDWLDCIANLPARQREILGLIVDSQYEQVEAARALGITQAAVSQALNRAVPKLRECLRRKGWLGR